MFIGYNENRVAYNFLVLKRDVQITILLLK